MLRLLRQAGCISGLMVATDSQHGFLGGISWNVARHQLSASLAVVQGGKIHHVNSFTVGRSPNQLGSPAWHILTITLAFGFPDSPDVPVIQLGSSGHSRSSGAGGD